MKKCDVVMKGGITSGIVYPGAVCELAKDFRFVNIGGTSAGAIAAALTAAAEYRRQCGSSAGFEELATLPKWLAGGDGDRSRLLQLFRPDEETAPIFDVAMTFLGTRSTPRRAFALAQRFNRFGGVVLAIASVIVALLLFFASGIGAAIVIALTIVVAAVTFVLAAAVEAGVHLFRVLPRHGFGICSGDALAEWLAAKIDAIAGSDHPLTFGDLAAHGINLEVMTTNLTHGRPYRMPFESRQFWFSPREMRRLFPERVVQWMIERARPMKGGELYRLPDANDLPVIVPTRMSLSFPVLLAAVPLWSIDYGRRGEREPERCWFSDGGITSNFPVHFFDEPLPRWPTFAFNLAERTPRYHDETQSVYVPRTNKDGILEWWSPIGTLFEFLRSIAATMQNWRDNMLLRQPGQRDRIAHVLLSEEEGGLNLTMPGHTIERVAAKGADAARELRTRFAGLPPEGVTLTWQNHKWVRFLALMPALEETLERWAEAFGDREFQDLLSDDVPLPSYRSDRGDRRAMRAASLALLRHVRENFGERPFRRITRRPRPEPLLRPMPRE